MGSLVSLILFINLSILVMFSSIQIDAQLTNGARLLDRVLQDYAFRYYTKRYNTKTGCLYRVRLPNNFSDIQADIVRFRCGSLRRYGASIKEFRLAAGISVQPCVERVVFIRQNLGNNWSSIYYGSHNLSGYQLVSPVLGLLAYDATDLSSTRNLSQPEIFAERNPVKIYFSNVTKIKSTPGVPSKPLCARFGFDGKVSIYDPVSSNVCVTAQHGHFGLVIETPAMTVDQPPGKLSEWKIIIGSSIGGAVGLFLLGLLLIAMVVKVKKRSKMTVMERKAYEEEALQISMVGHVRMPTAPVTRTRPSIEHEYSPP